MPCSVALLTPGLVGMHWYKLAYVSSQNLTNVLVLHNCVDPPTGVILQLATCLKRDKAKLHCCHHRYMMHNVPLHNLHTRSVSKISAVVALIMVCAPARLTRRTPFDGVCSRDARVGNGKGSHQLRRTPCCPNVCSGAPESQSYKCP